MLTKYFVEIRGEQEDVILYSPITHMQPCPMTCAWYVWVMSRGHVLPFQTECASSGFAIRMLVRTLTHTVSAACPQITYMDSEHAALAMQEHDLRQSTTTATSAALLASTSPATGGTVLLHGLHNQAHPRNAVPCAACSQADVPPMTPPLRTWPMAVTLGV